MPEIDEPAVALRPMTAGGEVVEDYGHVGLTLRHHPVAFLRADLRRRRIVTCAEAMQARDGRWLEAAGLVLVRQRPGSAKGVMFITHRGRDRHRQPRRLGEGVRADTAASSCPPACSAVRGRIQREGEVVHLVAQRLRDLSADLASVGEREAAFPLPHGRGDEFHHGSSGTRPARSPAQGLPRRDIVDPYGHIDSIKVKTRDFR